MRVPQWRHAAENRGVVVRAGRRIAGIVVAAAVAAGLAAVQPAASAVTTSGGTETAWVGVPLTFQVTVFNETAAPVATGAPVLDAGGHGAEVSLTRTYCPDPLPALDACLVDVRVLATSTWDAIVSVTFPGLGDGGSTTVQTAVSAKADTTPPVITRPALPPFADDVLAIRSAGYTDLESGETTEDVRVRSAARGATALGPWQYPASWQDADWGGWLALGLELVRVSPGVTICESYRARDRAGNVTPWTAPQCSALLWDDRALAPATRGWTRGTGEWRMYAGATWTRATARGATLLGPVVGGRRIGLLATTCPTCGSVDLYIGTRYAGTLSLASNRVHHRALLMTRALATPATGRLRVVVRTSGRPVIVDALGSRVL